MKRFAKLLVVTFGFRLLGLAMSLVSQKNATGAPGGPVTVLNTLLPVHGRVNATVTGTVGIAGTPSVSVSNFPAFPTTLTGSTVPVSGSVHANVTFPRAWLCTTRMTVSEFHTSLPPAPIPIHRRSEARI
jgi:hypothetical protein